MQYVSGRRILDQLSIRFDFVSKLLSEGFKLEYLNPPFHEGVEIRATLPGEEPITTELSIDDGTGLPYNQHIIVPEHMQRRGIGITIYLFVKKLYRKPIFNYWENEFHDGKPIQSEA